MITERAMLAAVHISIWTAVKHDRKVSRDDRQSTRRARERRALQTNNSSVVQRSLTRCGPSLDKFDSTSTRSPYRGPMKAIVCYLHTSTLNSPHRCESLRRAFSESVEEFLEVYPSYIEQVRFPHPPRAQYFSPPDQGPPVQCCGRT